MKEKNEWAILPYNSTRIEGNFLISTPLGSWSLLDKNEFLNLEQYKMKDGTSLYNRLFQDGVIVNQDNFTKIINEYRVLNSHLFSDTSLHIAVVTTRCNLSCHYCQTKTKFPQDMDFEVATKVLEFLFGRQNQNMKLEFQGGEPLLNWKIVKFLIEHARKFNTSAKNLQISLVTNGILLDEKKIKFLLDYDVDICISLDGFPEIHNKNRVLKSGQGTYKQVISSIKRLENAYKKKRINKSPDFLLTVTRHSLAYPEKIIDEYIKLGARQIALRPVNKIGFAKEDWQELGYSAEEFNQFWAKAMDYILKLNRSGTRIIERLALVMLRKIMKKENPGYIDLMSPCGAGRSNLVYMPNGDAYPCDEARMSDDDIFKLGNILKDKYEDLVKSTNLFSVCQASLVDLWDYNCAYSPWIGTCPVLNYRQGGNLVPKITATPLHKIYHFQFEYLFKKMAQDKNNLKIFQEWLK